MTHLHRIGAPTAALLVLAVLPFALAACGGSSSTTSNASTSATAGTTTTDASSPSQAKAAVLGYFDARAASEWAKACTYLAEPIRRLLSKLAAASKSVGGEGCAAAVKHTTVQLSSSERAALARIDVTAVHGEGDSRRVVYRAAGEKYAIPTTDEADGWKLVAAVGTPLKP